MKYYTQRLSEPDTSYLIFFLEGSLEVSGMKGCNTSVGNEPIQIRNDFSLNVTEIKFCLDDFIDTKTNAHFTIIRNLPITLEGKSRGTSKMNI